VLDRLERTDLPVELPPLAHIGHAGVERVPDTPDLVRRQRDPPDIQHRAGDRWRAARQAERHGGSVPELDPRLRPGAVQHPMSGPKETVRRILAGEQAQPGRGVRRDQDQVGGVAVEHEVRRPADHPPRRTVLRAEGGAVLEPGHGRGERAVGNPREVARTGRAVAAAQQRLRREHHRG
jgi:hypothetical protein